MVPQKGKTRPPTGHNTVRSLSTPNPSTEQLSYQTPEGRRVRSTHEPSGQPLGDNNPPSQSDDATKRMTHSTHNRKNARANTSFLPLSSSGKPRTPFLSVTMDGNDPKYAYTSRIITHHTAKNPGASVHHVLTSCEKVDGREMIVRERGLR